MPAFPWQGFGDVDPQAEYLVMASRLPLRSYWKIPTFLRLTMAVRKQLAHSEGLAGYSLNAKPLNKSFWTLSAWRREQDLNAFARAMPHLDIMRRLRPHMGRTRFVTWTVPGSALPISWDDAMAHLADGDRPSTQNHAMP